ncbi:MAG: helix-turn-helix transcriptional regulator [Sedimentitalea sp.]
MTLLTCLRTGGVHRAQDLATATGVSVRSIYRDMERLAQAGVPLEGTPGTGYHLPDTTTLPPITLTPDELAALNLALAIVTQSPDPDLQRAALQLTDKIDHGLTTQVDTPWRHAVTPLANMARAFAHIAPVRAAIKARQKLQLSETNGDHHVYHPHHLDPYARAWTLTGYSETKGATHTLRLDLITDLTPLPELFTPPAP